MFGAKNKSLAILSAVICVAALPAYGQTQLRQDRQLLQLPIDERIPEELTAPGVQYKGMIIKPILETDLIYDSNIYAEDKSENTDFILSLKPEISFLKRVEAHRFLAGVSANLERFIKEPDENNEEYNAFIRGNIDLGKKMAALVSAAYVHKTRQRSTPKSGGDFSDEPVYIDTYSGYGGIERRFGRLNISLLGSYAHIENENGWSSATDETVIYSDNDRDVYGASIKLRYSIPRGSAGEEGHILYADYKINKHEYKRQEHDGTGFLGIKRDNMEQGFLAGFETEYKGILFANLGAGYFWQEYDDSRLDTTDSLDFNADIAWNVLPKMTLSFNASREIEQNNDFLGGYVRSSYGLGVDYEFLHNLYLDSSFTYADYDFSGNANREDNDYITRLGIRYLHSRNFESAIDLTSHVRNSDAPENEFERMIFMMRLTGKL